nr:unnamed protein product [Spirometra erinaceieuropaei]
MAFPQAKLFEDEFPLVRSCPTLNEIRIAEEIKDLTIEVKDGALLHAHRIILAARIPSLRASLSGPHGEDIPVLKWPSVPLSLATSLVHYAYTGQVEMTQASVKGIFYLARLFKLSVLENWAAQFMANTVNSENLATTWDFARSLNVRLLLEACVDQMRKSFESFIYSDLFVRLPADTVLTLLRSDNLPVNSEKQVFGAISRWVCDSKVVDDARLKMHAPTMLKEVQWHQTTVEFRQSILERHPMFTDGPGCGRLMALVEQWIGAADRDKRTCPFNQNGRGVRPPQTFFIFGKEENQERWSVLRLDSNLKEEERVADMELRWGASYTVVGDLRGRRIQSDEIMVSFDVTSLFTSIPPNVAREVLRKRLEEAYDETQNALKIEHLIRLFEFCQQTFFTFAGETFEQIKGTPMGSLVSGLVAELVLQEVEKIVFLRHEPVFWRRYVDDTFVIVKKDML